MDKNNIKTSSAFFVIVATLGMATAFTTSVQRGIAALSSDANFTNTINPVTLGNPLEISFKLQIKYMNN